MSAAVHGVQAPEALPPGSVRIGDLVYAYRELRDLLPDELARLVKLKRRLRGWRTLRVAALSHALESAVGIVLPLPYDVAEALTDAERVAILRVWVLNEGGETDG